MLLERKLYLGLGMDAIVAICCMLLEHERDFGLGMDDPVTACSWNANVS